MGKVKYHLTIKEMPETERPREKLYKYGVASLTDAELLAIIIGTGSYCETALQLASKVLNILHQQGGISALMDMTVEELSGLKGMGKAKACKLLASAELSTRIRSASARSKMAVRTPYDAAFIVMEQMRHLKKEHFKILLLNVKNRLVSVEDISVGSLSASVVHPREIFKMPIKKSAAAIILIHNHPSGDPTPSQEDIDITRRIHKAGEIIGIDVLDHIIIGDGEFSSLKEKGVI